MTRFTKTFLLILLIFSSQLIVNCSSDDDLINEEIENSTSWMDDLERSLGSGTKAKLNSWIDKGLDKGKLKEAFSKAKDKAGLMTDLENAQSIYHQRVYIEDWDNIPGIAKSDYSPNGLTSGMTHPAWKNSELDLPAVEAANFVDAVATELPAGTKIYRITGGNPAGGYWTKAKPSSIGDVIGGTAVQPAWNNFSKFYTYEVPQAQKLKVWQGTTARQPIAAGVINPHLPGGEIQLFLPLAVRDETFKKLVQEIPLPW
ncbi:hypothetical protein HX021_18325 [Sphingobacterium sp. N143]|uniref:hypothetical protein n=1 Tax=Sphingobacterium sp. N143 TaxID=2746727 RepID=UPI002578E236|nr:hypothetical protein [Sphingobacterium sp. N143]MDM1296245.1 hypothetical protein [Sphingobacterium sp. N143]